MRLSFIGVFLQCLFLNLIIASGSDAQRYVSVKDVVINIDVNGASLKQLFDELEQKTDFQFTYDNNVVAKSKTKFSISGKRKSVEEILLQVSKQAKLRFKQVNNNINVNPLRNEAKDQSIKIVIQGVTITGKVTSSEDDRGLPGVNVIVKGTSHGTVTDVDGNYSLEVQGEASVLVFSSVGYVQEEITVALQKVINISMVPDIKALEEIVVIGYGTAKKSDLTGAVIRADIETFRDQPNTSIMQSMQGTVPGLNVGAVTRPGQNPGISIRGRNSISGSRTPLIVLDGIIYRGSIVDINVEDVQSVDILKDASSKAIYGSQAANGVIIITTRSGKKEKKPVFNIKSSYTVQTPSNILHPLNRSEYIDKLSKYYWEEAFLPPDYTQSNPNYDPADWFTTQEALDGYNNGTYTNWLDLITQKGIRKNINLSMAGSGQQSSYFISAGFTDEQGYMINDKFDKVNLRINFDHSITDWMNIGLQSFMSSGDYSGSSPRLISAYLLSPLAAPYDDDGTLILFPDGSRESNPLANLEIDDLDKRLNLFGNFYADIRIPFIKGLSYKVNYSLNNRTRRNYQFNKFGNSNKGSAFKDNSFTIDRTLDNILTYKRVYFEKHEIDVTLLYGWEKRKGESTNADSGIFTNDVLGYNRLEAGEIDVQLVSSGAWEEASLYQLGRLNYKYDNKYLVTLNMRRDGFSGFGLNNKFGIFPSLAVAWIASNERFIAKAVPLISNLKLRASYGSSGNRTVGRYKTLATVNAGFVYVFGDGGPSAYGTRIASMANNDLGWETTKGLNIGLDFGVFQNRLNGNFEYYDSKTEDILFNVNIPRITGFSSTLSNIGQVGNKGFEISLSSINIKAADFVWTSNVIFSRNTNKIISILGRDDDGDGHEDDLVANGLFIGEALGAIYSYSTDGIYQIGDTDIPDNQRPGQYRIVDLNDDGQITSLDDRSIIGFSEPAYRFGISNEFTYKNFTFSAFINSIQGGKKGFFGNNTPNKESAWGDNNVEHSNIVREWDYWTPSNPGAEYAGIRYTTPRNPNQYKQRNFVRLQDVRLAYELPESLLGRYSINAFRVFLSAKNLYTWTKWRGTDPETGSSIKPGSIPVMKSFSFGINVEI